MDKVRCNECFCGLRTIKGGQIVRYIGGKRLILNNIKEVITENTKNAISFKELILSSA